MPAPITQTSLPRAGLLLGGIVPGQERSAAQVQNVGSVGQQQAVGASRLRRSFYKNCLRVRQPLLERGPLSSSTSSVLGMPNRDRRNFPAESDLSLWAYGPASLGASPALRSLLTTFFFSDETNYAPVCATYSARDARTPLDPEVSGEQKIPPNKASTVAYAGAKGSLWTSQV